MRNYLSVDKQHAISSYGEHYSVKDEVSHEGAENFETAIILSFREDIAQNEIVVVTTKGEARLDFLILKDEI